jgi:hypothetical protein
MSPMARHVRSGTKGRVRRNENRRLLRSGTRRSCISGDTFVPTPDVSSHHRIVVLAPPSRVYRAILQLDLRESFVIRHLFQLRGMPEWAATFEGFQRLGFILLTVEENANVVLGVAGRFWTRSGELQRLTPEAFRAFARDGFAKATWSFSIHENEDGSSDLRTTTNVECFGPSARRRFKFYWLLVGPFSAWTRREALKIIKRQAEHAA